MEKYDDLVELLDMKIYSEDVLKESLEKTGFKDLMLSILLAIVYFSQFIWMKFIPRELEIFIIEEVLFNIIMLSLSIMIFYDKLKNDLNYLKKILEHI